MKERIREAPLLLRALLHYRPEQVVSRFWIGIRRRLATAFPAECRALIRRFRGDPPGTIPGPCPEPVRTYLLDEAVSRPEAEEDLLSGCFTFLGHRVRMGAEPDWMFRHAEPPAHLWRMNLHYFRFLVDAAVGAIRQPSVAGRLLDRASRLLDHWNASCPAAAREGWHAAWNSYSVSTRLMNARLARLLLDTVPGSRARSLERRLDGLGASSAAFLSRWLEFDLQGNHLLRNACALVAAGNWFAGPDGTRWRWQGMELLERELFHQVLSDGFHEERSPMYHALLLEDVLLSSFPAFRDGTSSRRVLEVCKAMAAALPAVLHPDREIALFNDSALGIAPPPDLLHRLATDLSGSNGSMAPHDLPDAGYYRMERGPWCVMFDAGPLGPDHLPAHAHCDALSFEASFDGSRLVTDTGVDRYEAGPERSFQRGTAAHSTLQVAGSEQAEPFGSFRMGRRPNVSGCRLDAAAAEGFHDGFRPNGIHRRRLRLETDDSLVWWDRLEGGSDVPIHVRLGLAPGVHADLHDTGASLVMRDGESLEFETPAAGTLSVEQGYYCERFGSSEPRQVLRWSCGSGSGTEYRFSLSARR